MGTDDRRLRLAPLALCLAGAALGLGLWAGDAPGRLRSALGPPPVSAAEAYAGAADGGSFDHARLDALLRAHVTGDGLVDYTGLASERAALDAYLAGETLSLNQIEHERIRSRFQEPRVHFALVCAALGCPPQRAEAYVGARLEAQLADQARRVHSDTRWLRFDPASLTLHLIRLYDWYGADFLQAGSSVEEYVAAHDLSVRAALGAGRRVEIRWLPYDWSLNERR